MNTSNGFWGNDIMNDSSNNFWSDKNYQTHLEVENISPNQPASLDLKKEQDDTGRLIYTLIPSKERIEQYLKGIDDGHVSKNPMLAEKVIAIFAPFDNSLDVFPTNTWADNAFNLPDKYKQIKRIRFEELPYQYRESSAKLSGMLKKIPNCFIKEISRGLGFRKEHISILRSIEEQTKADTIVVSNRKQVSSNKEFFISNQTLEELRREIDRIYSRAASAKREITEVTSHNVVAEILGQPNRKVKLGQHPMRKLITQAVSNENFVDDDQKSKLVSAVEANIREITKTLPDQTLHLKDEIEDITLARLIEEFDKLITQNHTEANWQDFFKRNPIIINVATSHPIIFIQDEASIGGRRLSGKGEKITDFLYRNHSTRNALVVELKTPQTKILNASEYRSGIFSPTTDVSGAINQVRDQRQKLIRDISRLKQEAVENDETLELETFSANCMLIVGRTPKEISKQRSWELFRGGLSDVVVITFDELLDKLKALQALLTGNPL